MHPCVLPQELKRGPLQKALLGKDPGSGLRFLKMVNSMGKILSVLESKFGGHKIRSKYMHAACL